MSKTSQRHESRRYRMRVILNAASNSEFPPYKTYSKKEMQSFLRAQRCESRRYRMRTVLNATSNGCAKTQTPST